MCDRAPEGEVEVVPNCFRVIQHSNWKLFLENQIDALHPSVVHQSTGRAAHEVEKKIAKQTGKARRSRTTCSPRFATVTIDKWDNFQTINYPHGHCVLTGYMGLRPQDPDTKAYDKIMIKAYGQKRFEEIVGVNIHHVIVYPGLSVQSPLQQLRAVRPLGVDRTLTEIWHFRLKARAGADLPPLARLLQPGQLALATLINADDLENFWKCHQGLVFGRRRLGELRAPLRPRHREGRRGVERAQHGHLGSADAQPDEGLGEVHAAMKAQHDVEQFLYQQAGAARHARSGRTGSTCSRPTASTGCRPTPDVQDLGRPAGDLRRGQEPDDGAHEPRAAPGRLVAAAAVGNQSRGFQRRHRQELRNGMSW